jgi:hypothetical protein
LAIALLAGTGLFHTFVSGVPATWDELFRLWLSRLPVVGALLWLALHASREAALSNRLEEDYGYKSAIAASFQGFHKQMTALTTIQSGSPVSDLCANTLQALANPPGRIYEKYKLTVTPADQISKLLDSLGDGIKNATGIVASKEKATK